MKLSTLGALQNEHEPNLIVRKTCGRENGDLLTTGDRVHDVNRGNTSLNHFLGVYARVWVDRRAYRE